MAKNVVIFSDGTGQAGGLIPDELRSNIYKLYRAARCGTDTNINPREQVAFYDPGLGSQTDGGRAKIGWWRWIRNFLSKSTGLGITENMVDCYSAIIHLWRPGDRIYLFGFSRGAYTVRCLGGVIALCGVPKTMEDGTLIRRDPKTVRRLAKEAVRHVYLHGMSRESAYLKEQLEDQRKELAKNFRTKYKSNHPIDIDGTNEYPHFIGVFDTVAALGAQWPVIFVTTAGILGAILALTALSAFFLWLFFVMPFLNWFGMLTAGVFAVAVLLGSVAYLYTHLKIAPDLKGYQWWDRWHFTGWKMSFYDTKLNVNVGWARHALSIDEGRKDFDRVKWGNRHDWRRVRQGEPTWFKQWWFAGNHSDIGGSYVENESRLSDTALHWIVTEAENIPDGLKVDSRLLHLSPDSEGMQHDECKVGIPFLYFFHLDWPVGLRKPVEVADLHDSVIRRFEADAVLNYDVMETYRSRVLREHGKVRHFFEADTLIEEKGQSAGSEAQSRAANARAAGKAEEADLWDRVAREIARR